MTSPFEAGFGDVGAHVAMLLDQPRVEQFARAIRAQVRPGEVVADIGAGSGILSLIAAQAGAGRVYAVERGPMAELAKVLARENGLHEVIEVLRCEAADAVFQRPPTLVVSETLGSFGPDEDILALLQSVRARCAPEVRFIPEAVEVRFAPLWDPVQAEELDRLSGLAGLSLMKLRARLAHRVRLGHYQPSDLRGDEQTSGWLSIATSPTPAAFRISLRVAEPGPVNAIGAWFTSRLAPGVDIASGPQWPATHWRHLGFPLDPPMRCEANAPLEVELSTPTITNRLSWSWRVWQGEQWRLGQSFLSVDR